MDFFNVESLLSAAGLIGLLGIVFVETGLLIGFILPGDSLLFTAGVFAAKQSPFASIWLLCILIPAAAIAGDQVGFIIGRKLGPVVLKSDAMRWIGPEQVAKTNYFFEKYGPRTVLLARFIAIVRTLTPVMAGISTMRHLTFTVYSVAGSILWGAGVTLIGYYLGQIAFIQQHIDVILIGAILVIVIPMMGNILFRYWRIRQSKRKEHSTTISSEKAEVSS